MTDLHRNVTAVGQWCNNLLLGVAAYCLDPSGRYTCSNYETETSASAEWVVQYNWHESCLIT